jgi:hypothetical protein
VSAFLYLVLALWLAVLDSTVASTLPVAPACWLALASWAMVAGEEGLWWRLWWSGLSRDLLSPLGGIEHTLIVLLLGILGLGARQVVSGRNPGVWFLWGMICHLLFVLLETGGIPAGDTMAAEALLTATLAMGLGLLFAPVPDRWHPLAVR